MPTAVVFNAQERAVSLDQNRLQTLLARDYSEAFRWMLDAGTLEDDAAGVTALGSSVTAPVRAVIINGVMARPEIGTTNMFVDPGCLFMVCLDSPINPDSSPFKLIIDPGVTTGGQLTMTPNTSGVPRIDLVECSRIQSQVLETDNRDIFSKTTGLFNATSVPKVTGDRIQYRIRTGPVGNAFPTFEAGWLPIAVCVVFSGATTWNDCFVWDVRPLASDLAHAPFDVGCSARPLSTEERDVDVYVPVVQGTIPYTQPIMMSGNVNLRFLNRMIGGSLSPNSAYFDLNNPAVMEPSFYTDLATGIGGAIKSKTYYVWLMCPFGLPRWAAYTPSSSGVRKPQSPRGIPVLSCTGPDANGYPMSPVQLPIGLGLGTGGVSKFGRMAFAGAIGFFPLQPMSARCVGNSTFILGPQWDLNPIPVTEADYMPVMYGCLEGQDPDHGESPWYLYGDFSLIDNITHPMNAKSIRVAIGVKLAGAPSTQGSFETFMTAALNSNGIVYWNTARSLGAGRRDPAPLVFGDPVSITTTGIPNLETTTVINASSSVSAPGTAFAANTNTGFHANGTADVGDRVNVIANIDTIFSVPGSGTMCSVTLGLYAIKNGGAQVDIGETVHIIKAASDGDPPYNTETSGVTTLIGTFTIAAGADGNLEIGIKCHALSGGVTATFMSAELIATVVHTSVSSAGGTFSVAPYPTAPSPAPTQLMFEIERIPLARAGNVPGTQSLMVVIDGHPKIDPRTALVTNPQFTTTDFTMNILGWEY